MHQYIFVPTHISSIFSSPAFVFFALHEIWMYARKIERNVMGMRKNVNRNSRLDSTDTNVDDLGSLNLNVEGKLANLIHFSS